MDEKKIKQYNRNLILVVIIALSLIYIASVDVLKYRTEDTKELIPNMVIAGLHSNEFISQNFQVVGDYIDKIEIYVGTYGKKIAGNLTLELRNSSNDLLGIQTIPMDTLLDNSYATFQFEDWIQIKSNQTLTLILKSKPKKEDEPVAIYYNTDINKNKFLVNEETYIGSICFKVTNKYIRNLDRYYLGFSFVIFFSILIYVMKSEKNWRHGKSNFLIQLESELYKYKFLMKQLIVRDFKTKYKRSILGMCWSFLNPLLTMMVQYVVFSTIFRSNIDNFPVYLLTAGIIFTFFTESVGNGLTSIVANASLITKVYVPKYIYPVTKVLSTSINLVISTLPLICVVLITGEEITRAILLFPYIYICLIIFCIGISFILSTSMVFFRDTQFLWGIVSLLWMYATPIFYPEEIIPTRFAFILKINPMYYFIKSGRTILLEGISPEPEQLLMCFFFSVLSFVIGYYVFKKNENKFILYI